MREHWRRRVACDQYKRRRPLRFDETRRLSIFWPVAAAGIGCVQTHQAVPDHYYNTFPRPIPSLSELTRVTSSPRRQSIRAECRQLRLAVRTCHRWRRDSDRSDANYRLLLKEAPQRTSLLPDGVPAAPALSQPDGFNRREIRKSPTYWLMSRLCSGVPTAEQPRDRRRWRFRLSGWRCSRAEPQRFFPGSLICPHLARAPFALAASGIALLATMAAAVPVGRLGPYRFGAEGKTG